MFVFFARGARKSVPISRRSVEEGVNEMGGRRGNFSGIKNFLVRGSSAEEGAKEVGLVSLTAYENQFYK